jgi:WD40 repeat protein
MAPRGGKNPSAIPSPKDDSSKFPPPEEKLPILPEPREFPVEAGNPILFPEDKNSRWLPRLVQEAHIMSMEKTFVPSEHDGKLLAVGTPVSKEEWDKLPYDRKVPRVEIGYLVIEIRPNEKVDPKYVIPLPDPNNPKATKPYRRVIEGEYLEPEKLQVVREKVFYRKIDVSDVIEAGQVLALINPALALDELSIKVAQLDGSEADVRASKKTKEEAERRYTSLLDQERRVPGSVSRDDMQGALLSVHRYTEEETAKRKAVIKAQREVNAAMTTLDMHEIKSAVPGVVRAVYKNRGDAVKNLEPVLEIQNPKQLRVEGQMEVQDTEDLQEGQLVWVQPTRPISPQAVLRGHNQEVTCVAVSSGTDPVIVSGSEDKKVYGWDPVTGNKRWILPHSDAVRAVACTRRPAKANLVLTGAADGTVRLLNLDKLRETPDKPEEAVRLFKERHKMTVNCVAFSPDGETCATGGDDRAICLWRTSDGELLHRVRDAHRAAVTSLQFIEKKGTENAKPEVQLVSAGGIELAVWNVGDRRIDRSAQEFDRRGGTVAQLGVSPDGRTVLFDQGPEIRLLSLDDKQLQGAVQNFSGSRHFTTMALFGPDGKTILTNGGSEGRLQLWRTPTVYSRAAELRQLVWAGGAATCAAFAPDAPFIVTGTQDHQVLVWRDLPGMEEVQKPLAGHISMVEKSLDNASRQVKVWAILDNPPKWVTPGGTATMVIPPVQAR